MLVDTGWPGRAVRRDAAQVGCVLGRDRDLGASGLSLIGECRTFSGRGLGTGGALWAPSLEHEHHSPGSRVTQSVIEDPLTDSVDRVVERRA